MPSLSRLYASTLASNAAILALGVVSGTLAARLLGPPGRGELAVIVIWPTVLAVVGSLGLYQAVTFFAAREPARAGSLLSATLVLAAAQTLILMSAGWFLLPWLLSQHRPEVVQLSRLFLLSIPLTLWFNYLLSLLQGSMQLAAYNLSRVLLAGWYAALIAALFLGHRPRLDLIIAGQLAGYAAICLFTAWQVRRLLRPAWRWDGSVFKPLLGYGVRNQLWGASYHLNQRLDQLVMSIWLPAQDLGLYVAAVTLASPLTLVPTAIGAVLLPAAARESPVAAQRVIRHSFRAVALLLGVAAAALYLLVPFLLPLFFGAAFAPAITACRVLVLAMIPLGFSVVLYESLRALNRPLAPAFAELVGIGATLALLYWLLPRYGYLGAAFASLGSYTAAGLVALWYTRVRAGIQFAGNHARSV